MKYKKTVLFFSVVFLFVVSIFVNNNNNVNAEYNTPSYLYVIKNTDNLSINGNVVQRSFYDTVWGGTSNLYVAQLCAYDDTFTYLGKCSFTNGSGINFKVDTSSIITINDFQYYNFTFAYAYPYAFECSYSNVYYVEFNFYRFNGSEYVMYPANTYSIFGPDELSNFYPISNFCNPYAAGYNAGQTAGYDTGYSAGHGAGQTAGYVDSLIDSDNLYYITDSQLLHSPLPVSGVSGYIRADFVITYGMTYHTLISAVRAYDTGKNLLSGGNCYIAGGSLYCDITFSAVVIDDIQYFPYTVYNASSYYQSADLLTLVYCDYMNVYALEFGFSYGGNLFYFNNGVGAFNLAGVSGDLGFCSNTLWDNDFYNKQDLSYDTGYSEGNTAGYNTGFTAGQTDGYDTGYSEGNIAGYSAGQTAGYDTGYSEGNTVGYNSGFDVGYTDGMGQLGFIGVITKVFSTIDGVLTLEIFPNFKLWYIVSLPVVFGVLMFFKKIIG